MSEEKKEFTTVLASANENYLPLIERQLEGNSIEFNDYARKCVLNAVASINQLLSNSGLAWNSEQLDHSNITQVLLNVASLELNPVAEPAECYFQIRNVKKKGKDGKDEWKKIIEFNVQADGNDAILSRFGRDVEKVYPYWLVREGDDFTYPSYNGLEYVPPTWTPKGKGEVVRVVYPVLHTDKTIHFYIGERDDVVKNLLAHINNNLMNETFGICADRFKATADQIKKINAKKTEIKAKAKELGLRAIDHPEISEYISPSWKEDFSRESMIIRKMRNNVVKSIPKDFGHPMIRETYMEATDDSYRFAKEKIVETTATVEVADLKRELKSPESDKTAPQSDVSPTGGITEPIPQENPSETESEVQEGMDLGVRVKPNFD